MNSFGTLFRITLYGESHQPAIGVIVDGVIPGVKVDEQRIKSDLSKRRPTLIGTTKRVEKDEFKILSGVFNGHFTGSAVHIMIENQDIQSKDYENIIHHPRPGHADYVSSIKYKGFQDYRGGGRFSGRLTAALTAAGAVAKMMIPYNFSHEIIQLGDCKDPEKYDDYLKKIEEEKDSVGGIILLTVKNIDIGLGQPFFNKLDSLIGQMMFSIPAVKGVEIGTGFEGIHLHGSSFNDALMNASGMTITNHSGGISGGISNGNDLVVKVFIKPASSIGIKQETYHLEHQKMEDLEITGRHDTAIGRRAGIVLENALAIVLADLYLMNKAYQ